jgi:exosortase/archaeosortase family protein
LGNLAIFYKILTPITVNTLNFFLSLTQKTQVVGNRILMEGLAVDIIPACVAGSAFYLLTILTMSIPKIKSRKRVKIIAVTFAALFIANITRLVILVSLTNLASFEFIHWLFYNILSIVFVVAIWVSVVKIYRIKEIPIYSDIKFLNCLRNSQKNPKRCK